MRCQQGDATSRSSGLGSGGISPLERARLVPGVRSKRMVLHGLDWNHPQARASSPHPKAGTWGEALQLPALAWPSFSGPLSCVVAKEAGLGAPWCSGTGELVKARLIIQLCPISMAQHLRPHSL